jgi:hypothetical protein
MALKKLGPHILTHTLPALAWAFQAPIYKTLDSRLLPPLIPNPLPSVSVWRHCFGAACKDQPLTKPVDVAANEILAALNGYRPDYVEVYNEIELENMNVNLVDYAIWLDAVTFQLHDAGLKVAGFSFVPGYPSQENVMMLASRGWADIDVLSIHEYWGSPNIDNPGVLYHRLIHEWTGGNHPPIIITECGRGGQDGWKGSGITAQQYAEELIQYDQLLQADDYVLGATVYTAGATAGWDGFDTDTLLNALGLIYPYVPETPGPKPDPEIPPIIIPTPASGSVPLPVLIAGGAAAALFAYGMYSLASADNEG